MMKRTIALAAVIALNAPLTALADNDHGQFGYAKFGITNNDMTNYKHLAIAPCATVREEETDPWHPPADAARLHHFAHLYAQCHVALEGFPIGILRANDYYFGMTCTALAMVDTNGIDPVCNMKSSLPGPQ